MKTFNFEALPILTKKEQRVGMFVAALVNCITLLFFILNYNIGLPEFMIFVYLFIIIMVSILFFIYEKKIKPKPKLSNFSIGLNDNGITVIDNDNEIFISKSEIYEIAIHFCNIKGEMPGRDFMASDAKDNKIKIIALNNTIEKRIFIPEDMFYHRFKLLGINLKDMGIFVKMKGFYE
jgi:hypothetical protein